MKKFTLSILTIFFSFFLLSCDDDSSSDVIFIDEKTIEGKWYLSLEVDSIVIVFEQKIMKEYIYDKNTSKLIERIDYGKYYLTQNNTGIRYVNIDYYSDYYKDRIYYNLNASLDTLTLEIHEKYSKYAKIK